MGDEVKRADTAGGGTGSREGYPSLAEWKLAEIRVCYAGLSDRAKEFVREEVRKAVSESGSSEQREAEALAGGRDEPRNVVSEEEEVSGAVRRKGMTIADARKAFDDAAKALLDAVGQIIPTKVVVVKKGDTLWSLAARELGSGNRWPEIYFMNLDVIKANQAQHGAEFGQEFAKDFASRLAVSMSTIYAGQRLLVMV